MDKDHLIAAIGQARTSDPGRTDECLSPEQIAAYMDRELGKPAHEAAEQHLAECAYCLGQIAVLIRSREDKATDKLPNSVLKQAEQLGNPPQRTQVNAPRWAAAAVVVLAVGIAIERFNSTPEAPASNPVVALPDDNLRLTRNIDSTAMRPELLAPSPEVALPVKGTQFKWTKIPGSLYYDIRLVSAEGEVIWQERVKDTNKTLPGQVELEAGTNYYVRVDAYLAEAKRVSSRHVLYTTEAQP